MATPTEDSVLVQIMRTSSTSPSNMILFENLNSNGCEFSQVNIFDEFV